MDWMMVISRFGCTCEESGTEGFESWWAESFVYFDNARMDGGVSFADLGERRWAADQRLRLI